MAVCVYQDSQDEVAQEAAQPCTSYADGARYTPLSSMPRCQRPNLAMSALVASSKLLTGPFVKKNPNMPASKVHLTRDRGHLPAERAAAMKSSQACPTAFCSTAGAACMLQPLTMKCVTIAGHR